MLRNKYKLATKQFRLEVRCRFPTTKGVRTSIWGYGNNASGSSEKPFYQAHDGTHYVSSLDDEGCHYYQTA